MGKFITYLVILIGTMATSAYADAPFCTEADLIARTCSYYDAKECRQEAKILGGRCIVNEEAIAQPTGYGNYCLVLSTATVECLYLDSDSCNKEAVKANGVCIRNYEKPEPPPSFDIQYGGAYQSF